MNIDPWLWGHDAGAIEGARIPPDDLTPEQQAEWLRGYDDGAGWNRDAAKPSNGSRNER